MNCTLELPQGHPRPSSVLVTWHRGHRGDSLMGMGKISEAEELQGRVETAWLENISASILHIHTLQQNDSAFYRCLFIVFLLAQPCLLEGNGTRLMVTGSSALGNTTRTDPRHSALSNWEALCLGLGALVALGATFLVLRPYRRRTGLASRMLQTSPLAGAGDSVDHSLRLMMESLSEAEEITYADLNIQPRTQKGATRVNSQMMAEEIRQTDHSIQPWTQRRATRANSQITSPYDTEYAAVRKVTADNILY
ncbi:uncharacterized protein [Emydura macquarii macquarii]|uniref:uncharacterized protein n=1 Tax=Emydura macquarii macquarii TaxID=1129001 RepID=UPI00352A2B30